MTSTVLPKCIKKLVSRANNHFLSCTPKKDILLAMGNLYMGRLRQRPPAPSFEKQTLVEQSEFCKPSPKRQDKTRSPSLDAPPKISLVRSLPSCFPILYPLTPSLCPKGCMKGYRVKVFPWMVYYKWIVLRISILVGPKQGLLLEMQRPHFQYTSFTPLVWLELNFNQKGNLFLSSPLCKVWRTTCMFPILTCGQ